MSDEADRPTFEFGTTTVQILQGDILKPGVEVQAVVSTDDNYLTMGSGVSEALRKAANDARYIRSAQAQSPVKAGQVVVTKPYGLQAIPHIKWVLHGTAIDYDTADTPLQELVEQTTANCLAVAEKLRVKRILFPAFATGAGQLTMDRCAQGMCNAIKTFLAQYRLLDQVYVILWLPRPGDAANQEEIDECKVKNRDFIKEANLVLGTPYDPAAGVRQSWDFYGRRDALERLEAIVTGQMDDEQGKRHAIILGGPRLGKRALLDQLFHRARKNGGYIDPQRYVARLSFGRVHRNTPTSFIYRKFLAALAEFQEDEGLVRDIQSAYAGDDPDCEAFLAFLDRHADRFPEVVYLVDRLPSLLGSDRDARAFWPDLDRLQTRVRFVYTALDEEYQELRRERLEPLTNTFTQNVEEICLSCLTEQDLETWIDALFRDYLGCSQSDLSFVYKFFKQEAGLHPYLIGMLGYRLIKILKQDAIQNAGRCLQGYSEKNLQPYLQRALEAFVDLRQSFFDLLIQTADTGESLDLKRLAQAIVARNETRSMMGAQDAKSIARLRELVQAQNNFRSQLDQDRMEQLETRGMVVQAHSVQRVEFMADSFAIYVIERVGIGARQDTERPPSDTERQPRDSVHQPGDVMITLLRPKLPRTSSTRSPAESSAARDEERVDMQLIRALFRDAGATIDSSLRPMSEKRQRGFLRDLYRCITYWKGITRDDPNLFKNPEQAGTHILAQFTTRAIKDYLDRLPRRSTISLAVDHDLKSIPWELMLEPAYDGEIPFCIGRRVVGKRTPGTAPYVRGNAKVKALLIGDPTDNIPGVREEIERLKEQLQDTHLFEPIVRLGSKDCTYSNLLNDLHSGEYGLIHYSGHSVFDGSQSAWQLKDGECVYTYELTSALEGHPPALMFSSSCESAKADGQGTIEYEAQTFDLASAFLEAGVGAYIGTMWQVGSLVAQEFGRVFYAAFLGGNPLGECLRQAKEASRDYEKRDLVSASEFYKEAVDWLAFILYGDPHTLPGDLFPAMRQKERA